MTVEEIQKEMNQPGFSVMKCCRQTKLHPNTVYRIKAGKGGKPNDLTLEALEKYIRKAGA